MTLGGDDPTGPGNGDSSCPCGDSDSTGGRSGTLILVFLSFSFLQWVSEQNVRPYGQVGNEGSISRDNKSLIE